MTSKTTLEQMEQQIDQLPVHERLKLIAYISQRLSTITLDSHVGGEETLQQHREMEAEELLALCDAAAEMWEGEFDAAEEIRQIRQDRDEQLWPSRL